MKNKRKLVIGLLITLAVLISGFTFAYWASGITGDNEVATGTITIGSGEAVTTTVVVTGEAVDTDLTPGNYQALVYSVNWSGENAAGAAGAAGTLAVGSVIYSGLGDLTSAGIDAMFDFVVTSGDGAIIAGTPQDVTMTITFTNEPANKIIYDKVANGTLTVQFTFTVTPN